jgi:hypothetical protein
MMKHNHANINTPCLSLCIHACMGGYSHEYMYLDVYIYTYIYIYIYINNEAQSC